LLALANKYKVRVIFALNAGSGDYLGGIGHDAAAAAVGPASWRQKRQLK
jgi:hypothetical protein